jgi:preprotein translocase subunit SecG
MATHMTYIHWLIVLFFIILFILSVFVARKENPKIFWSMLFSSFLVNVALLLFILYVLDQYTKKAKVYNLKNTRLLTEEMITFRGTVRNEGDFKIGTVKLYIKLANKGLSTEGLKGSDVYQPSSSLFGYFGLDGANKERKKKKLQTLEREFVIARNLKPGKSKRFYIKMEYPPYFVRPALITKVYSH